VITLKEALTKSSEELADIKEELKNMAKSSQSKRLYRLLILWRWSSYINKQITYK